MGIAAKPLRELDAGQIFFLDGDSDTPYALLMGYPEGERMLGRDPPSLPIIRMSRMGGVYHPDRNGLALGSGVRIYVNGDKLDPETVRTKLSEIERVYKGNYRAS